MKNKEHETDGAPCWCKPEIVDPSAFVEHDSALVKKLVEEFDAWCDVRRNAPEWTTLGIVQAKIHSLFYAGLAQRSELLPCRNHHCECEQGKCMHPGYYDARIVATSEPQEWTAAYVCELAKSPTQYRAVADAHNAAIAAEREKRKLVDAVLDNRMLQLRKCETELAAERERRKPLVEALEKAADTFADLKTAMRLYGKLGSAKACEIAEEATRETLAQAKEQP